MAVERTKYNLDGKNSYTYGSFDSIHAVYVNIIFAHSLKAVKVKKVCNKRN